MRIASSSFHLVALEDIERCTSKYMHVFDSEQHHKPNLENVLTMAGLRGEFKQSKQSGNTHDVSEIGNQSQG